ncbi:phosphotransferase [Ciceribacter sp. L1K23]|uniref:aminoglycoside phosphotransferase family protein n=1 Tax=Ciceribacter sp. L1K23 TaxID=2820276 RepID=UPI001B8329CB|nr:phosphotransferase [Ciceribacter sp. L1K23]MBR0557491.1 phosphotransferase [Ciceribacter sp. L1K23]
MFSEAAHRRVAFLSAEGYDPAEAVPLAGDASARRYYRLPNRGVLLMEETPNARDLLSFVAISSHLNGLGLSAPRIHAVDFAAGLALVEDFGSQTFTRLLQEGRSEQELYELAVDALVHLHDHGSQRPSDVPPYDTAALFEELEMFTKWYVPQCEPMLDATAFEEAFLAEWGRVLGDVARCRDTLVLRDFHVDNLMVVEGRSGIAACGLLDFQDAVLGSAAYDLVSLTQDARRDLSPGLEQHLVEHYLRARPKVDRASFMAKYWLLAAHRHTKILGNFERLSKRDGKHGYLVFIPRVQRQLSKALDEARLDDIRELMESRLPYWTSHKPTIPTVSGDYEKAKTA